MQIVVTGSRLYAPMAPPPPPPPPAAERDAPEARTVEIRLPPDARGPNLVKRDGSILWRAAVPANGTAELRYRLAR